VRLLLEKGADVNLVGGEFGTALGAAAFGNKPAIVRLLLEKGADVNTVGGYYGTALAAAAHRGHEAIVRLLLEKGADVNIVGGEYGCALGAAAAGRQYVRHYRGNPVEVIALLLGAGVELEAVPVQYREFVQEAAEKAGIPRQLEAQAGDG
jgi:ankyrin repeat protein